jgi:hypothetical protein
MRATLLTAFLGEISQAIAVNDPTGMQWFWAVFGVFAYEAAFFVMATDETDGSKKHLNYKRYLDDNWPNWLFALICVPIVVFYGQQVWYYVMQYMEKDWAFMDVLFLGSGALADGLFWGLKKLKAIAKAVKGNNVNT